MARGEMRLCETRFVTWSLGGRLRQLKLIGDFEDHFGWSSAG